MATEKRLFDKKEAIKLLRGKCVGKYPSTFAMGLFAAADEIAKLSDVDAVEVVRCKDCKHFWKSFSGTHSCKLHKGLVGTKYDTYCSYGERKTENP